MYYWQKPVYSKTLKTRDIRILNNNVVVDMFPLYWAIIESKTTRTVHCFSFTTPDKRSFLAAHCTVLSKTFLEMTKTLVTALQVNNLYTSRSGITFQLTSLHFSNDLKCESCNTVFSSFHKRFHKRHMSCENTMLSYSRGAFNSNGHVNNSKL